MSELCSNILVTEPLTEDKQVDLLTHLTSNYMLDLTDYLQLVSDDGVVKLEYTTKWEPIRGLAEELESELGIKCEIISIELTSELFTKVSTIDEEQNIDCDVHSLNMDENYNEFGEFEYITWDGNYLDEFEFLWKKGNIDKPNVDGKLLDVETYYHLQNL